jgi:hypothetical protein
VISARLAIFIGLNLDLSIGHLLKRCILELIFGDGTFGANHLANQRHNATISFRSSFLKLKVINQPFKMRYSVIVAVVFIISSVIGSEKLKWNPPKFVPVPNSVFEVNDEHHELSQVKRAIDIEKTKTINRMNLYDFKSVLSYFRTELGFTPSSLEDTMRTSEISTNAVTAAWCCASSNSGC